METKIFVGRKLRSLRDLHGLTQSKMAQALNISPTYLNLLEHNNRHLTLNVLIKLKFGLKKTTKPEENTGSDSKTQ